MRFSFHAIKIPFNLLNDMDNLIYIFKLTFNFKNYLYFKIQIFYKKGGEIVAEVQQISGGAMVGWAIILAIILLFIPGLVIIFAWISVILMFLGGIGVLMAK